MATKSRPVLLLGSVPLASAAEVFEAAGTTLGELARRIPDGETGKPRLDWVGCQAGPFRDAVGLEPAGNRTVPGAPPFVLYGIKPGIGAAGVKFGPLGYAAWAIESYKDFTRLRAAGKIEKATRMQVSMPTPFAVAFSFSAPASFPAIWRIYERRMFEELAEMARAIPARDLAIQWDIAHRHDRVRHGLRAARSDAQLFASGATRDELADGIARAADSVPAEVEMGLHLCYGDPGHKHVVEPKHTGPAVELTNRLVTASPPPDHLAPSPGAARPRRSGLLRAARRAQAQAGHRALSRTGPFHRRPGGREAAHRGSEKRRQRFRNRDRMWDGPAQAGDDPQSTQAPSRDRRALGGAPIGQVAGINLSSCRRRRSSGRLP